MNRAKRECFALWIVLLAAFLVLSGCRSGTIAQPSQPDHNPTNQVETGPDSALPDEHGTQEESEPPADLIASQLEQLTTAEKIGQLVLVGMDGTKPDKYTRQLLDDYQVGGFIFYKDNIADNSQALSLFNQLKEDNASNPVPLFLSVDEEGGRVSRLPSEFSKMPTAAKIGGTGKAEAASEAYRIIGQALSGFGLNLDFAPVLDVHSNPDNPVIGDRAFGTTPEEVSLMGLAAMKGLSDTGVIPVVKHFPGHGDTSVDSHLGLPVVEHDLDRLREFELKPFADAIEAGADMVMIAHILLPKLDAEHPASFSPAVINDLLRQEMGYEGVIISDDMTMGAITENYKIEQAAVDFITAGGNIVLVGHNYDQEIAVIEALTLAVEEGKISGDMLDQRVYQILKLKQKYALTNEPSEGADAKAVNAEISRYVMEYIGTL
ncbi:glycoside hydrolase family 3 [Paenibacillus antibioticophila]|uniref:Glycoside hydrolase family 3 n=1 Tax=Paenibacillus antibioticophila TaxID=1274374 RepID=A0A919XXF1_9BACL|nr:beta-N-acetylhexosaminidase [Paenibacillus antibioticophila]GIO39428.1 glycoside hydrolase family 3 [Paenibacillus antibioticophila]